MRRKVQIMRGDAIDALDLTAARGTLLDWLRLSKGATGTKEGCAEGDCGACTVVLERVRGGRVVHEAVNSCIMLAGQADGARVVTVEDLSGRDGAHLHPVQAAMAGHHGSQCGFCTPGIVMSLYALHAASQSGGPRPVSRGEICDQLAGNLCRCTGYRPIIEAGLEACVGELVVAHGGGGREALAALADDAADVYVGDDAQFFAAPRSEATLAALYAKHPDAWLVSGATDLGLSITKGLAEPTKVIWLGRVEGLGAIDDETGELRIGAGATLARATGCLAAIDPDLGEVMRRFGSAQVRNSGTVGGNIANGSPIGDLAPCLIALGARLELARGGERRTIPLEAFFIAYKSQDRRPGEYVRQVIVPKPQASRRFRAFKISKRMDEDISAVMGAFLLEVVGRRVLSARIAFGGMAGVPARARAAESAIAGESLDEPRGWERALDALALDFAPLDDLRASAAYRMAVARNLMRKALMEIGGADTRTTRVAGFREAADVVR